MSSEPKLPKSDAQELEGSELDESELETVSGGMSIGGGKKHASSASAGKGAGVLSQESSVSGPGGGGSSGGSPIQTGPRPL